MLDLNMAGEPSDFAEKPRSKGCGSDSATSDSSILNAEAGSNPADEDSSTARPTAATALQFRILRSSASAELENEAEDENCGSPESVVVTKQLFPLSVVSEWPQALQTASSSNRSQWIDLPFCHSDAQPEIKVFAQQPQPQLQPPQQQQVKKSRRGPRSRSSQYRGVTFYRRTGRWESHIWLGPFLLHLIDLVIYSELHNSRIIFGYAGTAGNKFIWVRNYMQFSLILSWFRMYNNLCFF